MAVPPELAPDVKERLIVRQRFSSFNRKPQENAVKNFSM